jgi:hypothetical protein
MVLQFEPDVAAILPKLFDFNSHVLSVHQISIFQTTFQIEFCPSKTLNRASQPVQQIGAGFANRAN